MVNETACVGAEATVVTSLAPGTGHLMAAKNNNNSLLSNSNNLSNSIINNNNTITSSVQIIPPSTHVVKGIKHNIHNFFILNSSASFLDVEIEKFKCLYLLVETAMAVRQREKDQDEDIHLLGN